MVTGWAREKMGKRSKGKQKIFLIVRRSVQMGLILAIFLKYNVEVMF
jgi:hypothetical protein